MPTEEELLEGVDPFLRALDLFFPELCEITIPELTIQRMSRDIYDEVGDGEGSARSGSADEALSALKQRFRQLEVVYTENNIHPVK